MVSLTSATINRLRSNDLSQQGVVLEIHSFVVVRWGYLAYLATQVFLSVIFLGWVVSFPSHTTAIFKDSTMATLFAINAGDKKLLETALEEEKLDQRGAENSQEILSKLAAKTNAMLVNDERGWTLKVDMPPEESRDSQQNQA